MLFEHCSVCQSCCHIEPGYPPLEVVLTKREEKSLGKICLDRQCTHLGPRGCTLGNDKPLGCQLYPLSFDPESQSFFFDSDCPLMPEYINQLSDQKSDASAHLKLMKKKLLALKKTDPEFLSSNFQADLDYFDLKPIEFVHSTESQKNEKR